MTSQFLETWSKRNVQHEYSKLLTINLIQPVQTLNEAHKLEYTVTGKWMYIPSLI